ncbi:MAG: hypothetical protein ABSG46_20475 [Candidatus Binataceae bacterium]
MKDAEVVPLKKKVSEFPEDMDPAIKRAILHQRELAAEIVRGVGPFRLKTKAKAKTEDK